MPEGRISPRRELVQPTFEPLEPVEWISPVLSVPQPRYSLEEDGPEDLVWTSYFRMINGREVEVFTGDTLLLNYPEEGEPWAWIAEEGHPVVYTHPWNVPDTQGLFIRFEGTRYARNDYHNLPMMLVRAIRRNGELVQKKVIKSGFAKWMKRDD
jgi:hypothetical protein